jgi:hypothetical protein
MITSALHRGTPGAESTGRLPARWTRRRSALGRLAALALAASSVTLAAGCAATTRPAATASPRPPASASRPASVLSQPVTPPPVAPGGTAAPPAPQASPPAPASGCAGPHFDTPQAAMAYLASAYNSDNTTALHAVTEPRAFRALMGMRSEAVNLRLTRCTLIGCPRQRAEVQLALNQAATAPGSGSGLDAGPIRASRRTSGCPPA